VRAAAIVEVFNSEDPDTRDAIRLAVTAQSTRKRISPKLLSQLATALIIRAVGGDGDHSDRIRRYMRHGFAKALREGAWTATARPVDELVAGSLEELRADAENGGPTSLELAARAAFPLITTLKLWGDQGSGREQPDRRTPGEVIDVMRRSPTGVQQLARALRDYDAGKAIRAVKVDGEIAWTDDGAQEQLVNDTYLRNTFPAPGTVKRPASPETAHEKLEAALSDLFGTVQDLETAVKAVRDVKGIDGSPLVDAEGINPSHCAAWRRTLSEVDEALVIWGQQFKRRGGASRLADDADVKPAVDGADADDELVEAWDADAEGSTAVVDGEDAAAA
jgi:hypothetical protein